MLRQLDAAPQSAQVQDQKRQVTEHKRQLQELITRGNDTTTSSSVPAWVSLSLGSAYFRSGKLADAETNYKEAIAADQRSGEAHSNLAVVYLETARFADALNEINAAKKIGFKVNPELGKRFAIERSKRERYCASPQQLMPVIQVLVEHLEFCLFRPCPLTVDQLTSREQNTFVAGRVARTFLF